MIRTHHEGEVHRLLGECSDDEVKVIHVLLRRIHNARREYGPLRLKRDTRDMRHEAASEAFDALFYLCVEDVQRARPQEQPFTTCDVAGTGTAVLHGCIHRVHLSETPCEQCAAAERVRSKLAQAKEAPR